MRASIKSLLFILLLVILVIIYLIYKLFVIMSNRKAFVAGKDMDKKEKQKVLSGRSRSDKIRNLLKSTKRHDL